MLVDVISKKSCRAQGQNEDWTNKYRIDVADMAAALVVAQQIVAWEVDVHRDVIYFPQCNLDEVAGSGGVGVFYPAVFGDVTTPAGNGLLPLWNCMRITFGDLAGGRPEQKYLRVGLVGEDIVSGLIDAPFVSAVDLGFTQNMAGLAEYVGPGGEFHNTGFTHPVPQMRQLTWSRRTRPGFHRAYVPN